MTSAIFHFILSFAPTSITNSKLSVQWLYDHVSKLWSLPPDALETIKSGGGYYSTLIQPGLRLIALNNNVCYTFNWWIIYSIESIRTQFQWLHDVLLAAEKNGERVHLLAHIPNGDEDYHQPCSREYRRIIDRFHDTIAAQFNGHKEVFDLNIFHLENNQSAPVNLAWNGGGLSSFSGVNRNYNVYVVDNVTYVRNHRAISR
jgi:sphingomyelin phosphodiesterase